MIYRTRKPVSGWKIKSQWAEKFRSVAALRGDVEYFDVTSLTNPTNSGTASTFLPSPKLSLIFGPWAKTEFYAQGGFSFHSNDGRGATQTWEPISADYPNGAKTNQNSRLDPNPRRGNRRAHAGRSQTCKAPFRFGIYTAIPNLSRMATPAAPCLHNSRATATASNGRTIYTADQTSGF